MNPPLLSARGLKKYFSVRKGLFSSTCARVLAVDGIDLTIHRGETLGLVGESGCGKTTVAKVMIRAIPPTAGEVIFEGKNIFTLPAGEMRRLRKRIQMVYQDPYSSLNPRMKIGKLIGEAAVVHKIDTPGQIEQKVLSILQRVGLPADSVNRFPHEFSGGQRQRIGIARSLILDPELIILDEPVSALDVSIQAQVINLLSDLQAEFRFSYLLISHDLSLVKHICDRVAVMYLGKIVEEAETRSLYGMPRHPYTRALLSAIPVPAPGMKRKRIILSGDVPSPADPPSGCRFHTRCPERIEICETVDPAFRDTGDGHWAACHLN
ncbi:MAG: ATP-binding cassette domain-containing protein [Desulfobacteraceae bacterium]|nr:MAG: ATP-binding cassette domain-containing protein [Desulfobacteraceae bacterium]